MLRRIGWHVNRLARSALVVACRRGGLRLGALRRAVIGVRGRFLSLLTKCEGACEEPQGAV